MPVTRSRPRKYATEEEAREARRIRQQDYRQRKRVEQRILQQELCHVRHKAQSIIGSMYRQSMASSGVINPTIGPGHEYEYEDEREDAGSGFFLSERDDEDDEEAAEDPRDIYSSPAALVATMQQTLEQLEQLDRSQGGAQIEQEAQQEPSSGAASTSMRGKAKPIL